MFGFLDDLISSPGGGLLGDLFLGERKHDRSVHAAEAQMGFQERMRNTAYQAAVGDMKAAGLNPMLAYHQGGSHSPSGAMASSEHSEGSMLSSAVHARRAQEEVKNLAAERERIQAQTKLTNAQAEAIGPAATVAGGVVTGLKAIGSKKEQIQEKVTDFMERVVEELVPGIRHSAGQVASRVMSSDAGKLVEQVVENYKSVGAFIANMPERLKSVIFQSADQVKRREELKGAVIPPASRGKPRTKMRGKLGGAETWDYGPSR